MTHRHYQAGVTAMMSAASAVEAGVPNSRTADRPDEKQKPRRAIAGPGDHRSEPAPVPPRRGDAERPKCRVRRRAWPIVCRGGRGRKQSGLNSVQNGYLILAQFPDSKAKRRRFMSVPPGAEYEPSRPSAHTTRWHGIRRGVRLAAMQLPTARAAPACPAFAASSP